MRRRIGRRIDRWETQSLPSDEAAVSRPYGGGSTVREASQIGDGSMTKPILAPYGSLAFLLAATKVGLTEDPGGKGGGVLQDKAR